MKTYEEGACQRRFTLIEMLTVIAIVAILMSLLLPALSRTKERARRVLCINNQRQIIVAVLNYAADADSRIPAGGDWIDARPSMLYIMYQEGRPWMGADGVDRPANLGLLIVGGYCSSWNDDALFRCPSKTPSWDSRGDSSHFNYWFSPRLGTWVNRRAEYMRPDFYPEEDDWDGMGLRKLEPDQPLYADIISSGSNVINVHRNGVITSYADGSAQFVRDTNPAWLANPGRNDYVNNSEIMRIWDYLKSQH